MHNRARMIAATYLVKDLMIDWRLGEKAGSLFFTDLCDTLNLSCSILCSNSLMAIFPAIMVDGSGARRPGRILNPISVFLTHTPRQKRPAIPPRRDLN
jgi:FAD binding domain of DNA photolyase